MILKGFTGTSGAEVLKQYFSHNKLILAHGVQITDSDIEILKSLDCTIVHNPVSNLRLGCGIADITKYLNNGLHVSLGTDGQGSGSNLDLFESMRIAALLQGAIHKEDEKRISAQDAIKMATIEGAHALGLADQIGSIKLGKQADLILVDLEQDLAHIKSTPNHNFISDLVYNKNGYDVDTTIVNGEVLMLHKKILHLDEKEIVQRANQILS